MTTLDGALIRPHDIEVSWTPVGPDSVEGTVARVLRIGFEVRLTVLTDGGEVVTVEMTRTHARRLGVEEGSTVFLSAVLGATTV